ncbi:volume-regulated anion channel subunit LRRC8A-like [Parambassis ranga]|uniref:Volume-regulated anion channel subunit LRRC8A-like n=1 Tax=Parambassis ranga TaxID=210632 RepID=A0A6P7JC57_9TELE|nr:volume-regulated anion channel subunit LRRC8A-like [Parambassis ranga]
MRLCLVINTLSMLDWFKSSLKNLNELHLTGNLSTENNRYIVIDGLRELKSLKVLRLKSNLTKLPQVVTDVGVHLQKLSINNEGTKFMVLNSLKKMCFDSPWTTRALSETVVEESDPKPLGKMNGSMDKKASSEGEQAKALFEKVKKFRIHVEEGDIVYRLYVRQTVIKVIKFILIISYTAYYVRNIRRSLKRYSFESIREESSYSDIPDLKNDFAFMLHMIDQYDPLYSKRFAVFLSEVSENKLRQLNLNEWTLEKLRQRITKNSQDKLELHLFMLSGIPDTVFDLVELEVLKLELIPDVTIPPIIAQLSSLREMWLYHTPAKIEAPALAFLRENLKSLHIKFTDIKEIPLWIYSLKNLNELHLTGNLSTENNRYIVINGLRELKSLKVLRLKSNLTKLPQVVTDVGVHLQKLFINNEGTKLMVLNSLKKMVNRFLEAETCRFLLARFA